MSQQWEQSFNQLCDLLLNSLGAEEHLTIDLSGEQSHFMRLNHGKVRQSGVVTDGDISIRILSPLP